MDTIHGLSDQEMVLLAYEAAAGPVSKYVGGLYRENPALTWTELKSALIQQYASERTAIEAVRKLFRLRQGESEDMGDLGERIAGLAALAFSEPPTQNSGSIQALLADVYMDPLSDRELRGDVLREGPSALAAARVLGSSLSSSNKTSEMLDMWGGWLFFGQLSAEKMLALLGRRPHKMNLPP